MSVLTYLNPEAIKDTSIEGIKLKDASIEGIKLKDGSIEASKIKDGSISASKIDGTVASKTYVDTTVSSAIAASDAMVFKGTLGTSGTSESIPSTAIIGDTYKVISLTTIPSASSYTGTEETAKGGDLIVAMTSDPKWIVVPSGDDEITTLVQSITWSNLKAKRDASQLIPGMQYRITDYTCTTTQTNTQSAGHVFDIIVTADSESILNEEAKAIQHKDDTYFANCDLNVWKIWYSLDNDTTRFVWADKTNGKGVIYRMIDEWNNDVPYDFKNIQYTGSWGYYAYTFNWINDSSDNSCEDLSVAQYVHSDYMGGYNHTCDNIIKPYGGNDTDTRYPFQLNKCVFLNSETAESGMFTGCLNNVFENNCYNNTFKHSCSSNSFGDGCYSNSFGDGCHLNSFGNNCQNNSFGNSCRNNSFGNSCQNNSFKYSCSHNSFEYYCRFNSFGDNCESNAFGQNCYSNSFGDYIDSNSFGNDCYYIKFASDKNATTKYSYYQKNHFGDGCNYILFKGTETGSILVQVQNYTFGQGMSGTYSAYLTIDGVRNRAYETKVAKNSYGDIKTYCEADLIQ